MTRGPRLLLILLLVTASASAEDAFVGSKGFRAGLHQDRVPGSPIVKLVPAGAALQVLKREERVSLVRDGEGVQGWIDNSYLATEPPAESAQGQDQRKRIEDLEQQLAQARTELAQMEVRLDGSGKASDDFKLAQQLRQQNQLLEQDIRKEKLRTGELQVELTELRKRIGVNSDNESLYNEISALQAENRRLKVEAGGTASGDGAGAAAGLIAAGRSDPGSFATYAVVLLLLGFGGGAYFMDWLNRRRHGGFRV